VNEIWLLVIPRCNLSDNSLSVSGMTRNGWPEWAGISVRNQPESVSGMGRNTQELGEAQGRCSTRVTLHIRQRALRGAYRSQMRTLPKDRLSPQS